MLCTFAESNDGFIRGLTHYFSSGLTYDGIYSFRSLTSGPGSIPSDQQATISGDNDKENENGPSRYNLLLTVYFHLLTGPLGDSVRIVGDIIAWLTTLVGRKMQSILNWRRWPWRRKGESA